MEKALTIEDIITLGKMGFNKTDIAALLGAPGKAEKQAAPAEQPAVNPAPNGETTKPASLADVQKDQTTGAPDYNALLLAINGLSEKVASLTVPKAGSVGNVEPVGLDDIIRGAMGVQEAPPTMPDFAKGVVK